MISYSAESPSNLGSIFCSCSFLISFPFGIGNVIHSRTEHTLCYHACALEGNCNRHFCSSELWSRSWIEMFTQCLCLFLPEMPCGRIPQNSEGSTKFIRPVKSPGVLLFSHITLTLVQFHCLQWS